MRLMKSTDLALRLLMRLAVVPPDTDPDDLPTTREVAEAMGAAPNHMAKVVGRLQHLGLVQARRGRGGGLVLTAAGRVASVGAVVRTFEGSGDLAACVDDADPCPINAACHLRAALRAAQEAFYTSLDTLTIADVTASPTGPLLLSIGMRR